jgi:hypothetical protein
LFGLRRIINPIRNGKTAKFSVISAFTAVVIISPGKAYYFILNYCVKRHSHFYIFTGAAAFVLTNGMDAAIPGVLRSKTPKGQTGRHGGWLHVCLGFCKAKTYS